MPTVTLAFDRSARTIDTDGRMHVAASRITKAAVNPYYGKEIVGGELLGLEPDKLYRLLRDPVELEKGAATFARLPILSKHVQVTAAAPQKEVTVGTIGSAITFEAPYLIADLCIWDAKAIAGIDTDTIRELSCSYHYVPVMEPGVYEGEAYDGRMTEIRGNHLALVEYGRAGSDVLVSDSKPFIFDKDRAMKMTKTGKALFAALCAMSGALAADAALGALVADVTPKTKAATLKAPLLAMDASLDSNKLDAVLDAILDVEQEPTPVTTPAAAVDESPADKLRKLLAGKVDDATLDAACALLAAPAEDETPPGGKPDDVKTAMDSLRRELRDADDARRDVRPVIGDVLACDSAAEIYGMALDHLKIDRKGVDSVPALRALYKLAAKGNPATPAPKVAHDAAGLATRFPNAARFGGA